jgi:hypothetical protein
MDFITMALGDDVALLEEGGQLGEQRQQEQEHAAKSSGETSSDSAVVSGHDAGVGQGGGDQAGSRFWDDFCLYLYRRTYP